jgi:hypothetical protein
VYTVNMPAFYQWRMNLRPSTEPKMDEGDESAEIEVADEAEAEAEAEPCSGRKRASSGTKSKKGKRNQASMRKCAVSAPPKPQTQKHCKSEKVTNANILMLLLNTPQRVRKHVAI